MHSEHRWQDTSIIEKVFAQPTAFEFVQATRLLRHIPFQSSKKIQHWADQFNFSTSLNLKFPLAEIESLTIKNNRVQLTSLVFGLSGIQGNLPYLYTTKIRLASKQQRQEIRQFLGLFNHKLSSQYVDASLNYNLAIRYEVEKDNLYLNILHALNGYLRHQQYDFDNIVDDYFAEFSGLMQGQNNSTHALKTMLSCIFKQHVNINEFILEKFKLAKHQQSQLQVGQSSQLGVNSFCGEYIQQIDGKIEIEIGPLSYKEYLDFLPQGKQSKKLKSLLQTWCTPTLLIDVRLILDKQHLHPLQLNSHHCVGLAQAALLMPKQEKNNRATCYAIIREAAC